MIYAKYAKEALNTVIATRWQLFLARLFGKTIIGVDGRARCHMKQWRGKTYLIDVTVIRLEQ